MAKSNAHKFGQMIGDLLEVAIIDKLKPVCKEYNMYLDYQHMRKARNNKKKVRWEDEDGNKHDLDIVIEINGSEEKLGDPKAFIEMAWRRSTRHSKNKVQEIAGAVLPIVKKYNRLSPFYGAVLAGEFTSSSLHQLESQGFKVLYFDIGTIIQSFKLIGLEIEWDDNTDEDIIAEYIKFFNVVSSEDKDKLIEYIFKSNEEKLNQFIKSLKDCFLRKVERIRIFTLYGDIVEVDSIDKAIEYINNHDKENTKIDTLIGYEIYVKYNNGDKMEAEFKEKRDVLRFLNEL
ncbi:DNA methylase [Clostridioides sp. ES-S-0049-02]|uniref:hypothetical protein n=1 Tax=Clostridioides sp. ES-S-0049-02 TaxID=2770778 RepID=UPI001D129835|nr:DNA methylase [Clostridioides sp. ES-S-0049-02]